MNLPRLLRMLPTYLIMLVVIVLLIASGVGEIYAFRGEPRHYSMGLVIALGMLVNHLIESFLSEAARARVRVPQFVLAGMAFAYVVYAFGATVARLTH